MSSGISKSTPTIYPNQSQASGNVSVVSAASTGTKGAWVQLIASTSFAALELMLSLVQFSSVKLQYDLGVGAAASEVVKVADIVVSGGTNDAAVGPVSFPFSIPAGSRIAMRVANMTDATAKTCTVGLTVLG